MPAAARHPGRYFVLALYDAYTENFANLGPRNGSAQGEVVWLLGPNDATPIPPGQRVQALLPGGLEAARPVLWGDLGDMHPGEVREVPAAQVKDLMEFLTKKGAKL